ncbi:hypothetical protein CPB83DRAFT_814607 [Crepidotus variabilis]|uniref:Fe2OG dioxygenase domain-containing protein n=1 Tax=Crepidotus variabilis TaxID=179855 RepID=A0A9P6EEJ2_9AGAR|nr:hypothetical protein CPB83DRAFT_814607 [Crepidotus variabilis]
MCSELTPPNDSFALGTSERKRQRSPDHAAVQGDDPNIRVKRPKLPQINTNPLVSGPGVDEQSSNSPSSLFSASDTDSLYDGLDNLEATISSPSTTLSFPSSKTAPPIPGLFLDSSIAIPEGLANEVMDFCMKTYFTSAWSNQVMLFGRFLSEDSSPGPASNTTSGLPPILLDLLKTLSALLQGFLPSETYDLLFPTVPSMARQAIINLYQPGEGITPHVDLLGRYGDGIMGVSFGSSCAMRFDRTQPKNVEGDKPRWDVFLPERSIIVLTKEARYDWTHGIDKKTKDLVDGSGCERGSEWVERGVRMSVTFRWMLPGADLVGDSRQ